ncbi:unnamed protein product, partial [Rotaria sp. Silwood1]
TGIDGTKRVGELSEEAERIVTIMNNP